MIRASGFRVLLEPDEMSDTTLGGIIIPDEAKKRPREATVVSVGEYVTADIEVDDRVLYTKYGGALISYGDKSFMLMDEDDILAKLED